MLNPFSDIQNWKRKDYPELPPPDVLRMWAERETARDLEKPPQQLLCDTMEETLLALYQKKNPDGSSPEISEEVRMLRQLLAATRRMTSLQVVMSHENGKTNAILFWFSVLVGLIGGLQLAVAIIDLCKPN